MSSAVDLPLDGYCADGFEEVRDVLREHLGTGADLGASVAVDLAGELVVDLWGGWADEARTSAWQSDTITNVWSTTKTMAALCMLILVERGLVDVDAPVATYWPEFAANGKDGVLVRHIMSHTAGLSAWEQPITIDDVLDWEVSTAKLAAQAPWWEPGTASGYHLLSQGHLIGEVVRRVTGLSLGTFFRREVAEPLGADFHIGLADDDFARVSDVVPPPPLDIDLASLDLDGVMVKSLTGPLMPGAQIAWTPQWRRAEVPAANGHGNARSVAVVQSVVACGGSARGVNLLSPATVEMIFREQSNGVDLVLGLPQRFGIGYGLADRTSMPNLPDGRICYWGGWGGSVIIVDIDRQLTIAYMMNKMESGVVGDFRGEKLARAAYRALGVDA